MINWILAVLMAVTSTGGLTNTEYEHRIQTLINTRHVPDLRKGECVDGYAERHAARLGGGDLYHQSMGPIMRNCNGIAAGEIIARGHATPREIFRAWLDSDAHRQVLLKQRWDRIGVGARHTTKGRVVVVDFLDKP